MAATSYVSDYDTFMAGFDYVAEAEQVMFQGVNALVIRNKVLSKELDQAVARKEIMTMIVMLDLRGSRWNRPKIHQKMMEKGWKNIQSLMTKYDIQAGVISPQDNKTVTPARLGIAFPHLILRARVESEKKKELTGGVKVVGDGFDGNANYIMFPGGSALIPRVEEWQPLYNMYVAWAISFDRVIHQKDGKYTDEAVIEGYARTARTQCYLSDNDRIKLMKLAGISSKAE